MESKKHDHKKAKQGGEAMNENLNINEAGICYVRVSTVKQANGADKNNGNE